MADLLDISVRAIKAQMIADQIFDLVRLGQADPDLLFQTIEAIDRDCLQVFLQQFCKRIRGA